MKAVETRYPCPVCLGVTLKKISIDHGRSDPANPATKDPLTIDYCGRCGGVWFGPGEVRLLRNVDQAKLWAEIVRRSDVHHMQCHQCHTHVARTEQKCAACGWQIRLDCPECERPLEVVEQDVQDHASVDKTTQLRVRLDVCRSCKGVWFDHDELESIWKLELQAHVQRRGETNELTAGSLVLLEALTYDPFLAFYGVQAAGYALGGAAELISKAPAAFAAAPEAVSGMVEVAGEAASSVFETIVEIISGIFN
jgi:Zn-finger nucleic acid-binding protein